MTHTYCRPSRCALAEACARYEDDAGKHLLNRTYSNFNDELMHQPDSDPLFFDKHAAANAQARSQ